MLPLNDRSQLTNWSVTSTVLPPAPPELPPIWTAAEGAYSVPDRLIWPPPDSERAGCEHEALGVGAASCQRSRFSYDDALIRVPSTVGTQGRSLSVAPA